MVVRSIPASRSQKLKVPNTSSKGKPAENPKDSMRSDAGSKYTLSVAAQEGLSVVFAEDVGVAFMHTMLACCLAIAPIARSYR